MQLAQAMQFHCQAAAMPPGIAIAAKRMTDALAATA